MDMQNMSFEIEDILGPERMDAIRDYTAKLRKKFPHFSEQRLAKKVADHFKIKLIPDEGLNQQDTRR